MLTIKTKIILFSSIVFGIILMVLAVLVYRVTEQAEFAKLDARLDTHSEKLLTEIDDQITEDEFPLTEDFDEVKTEGLPVVHYQIWSPNGDLLVKDSVISGLVGAQWKARFATDTAQVSLVGPTATYRCRWVPVEVDEEVLAVLQAAVPLHDVREALDRLRMLFLFTIPGAIIIVSLATLFITRSAFRPLTGMAEAAREISASNLDQRLTVPSTHDEVRSLADTLNRMIERIEAAFRSQRQFVADASHEIRTPLTVISSELEFVQRECGDAPVRQSIKIALSEIDRMNRMVDSLLLLARLDSSQAGCTSRLFRLDEMVVEVAQLMKRVAANKNVSLDLQLEEVCEVCADIDMVRRAVVNVTENAVKYSPAGGTVTMSLVADSNRPGVAVLQVTDRGNGIQRDEQSKVFDRFYRSPKVRSETNGSGLGLAIAKRLLEMNGGAIRLWSEESKGTRVTIELPRVRSGA